MTSLIALMSEWAPGYVGTNVRVLAWHLAGHYTQVAPSEKLIQEWNRIITLKWI
jgi:hypothetical protein